MPPKRSKAVAESQKQRANAPLRLAMVVREGHPQIAAVKKQLTRFLKAQKGTELVGVGTTDDQLRWTSPIDMVIVVGGDGTILRTCRQMGTNQLPMVGVNLGRLGFLADLSPDELCQKFGELERGQYRIAHHLMFHCELERAGKTYAQWLGLNEVTVQSGGALQLISVEVAINSEHVATYRCDGLIISTPVGSTAHNLAAGGPILRQDLEAFVLTPICPHTLTNRPLVDRADCEFELKVPNAPDGCHLVIDGQIKQPLTPADRVVVKRAEVSCQLIRLRSHSYYKTLHDKLGWAGQPQYGY